MTRRVERELLFSIIYELSFFDKEEYGDQFLKEKDFREIDSDYVEKCVHGIILYSENINDYISGSSKGWKISRLSKITLSILQVAVYEMIFEKLAYTIAINEAVELAKKYDDDKAPAFVNGVLNNIALAAGLKE